MNSRAVLVSSSIVSTCERGKNSIVSDRYQKKSLNSPNDVAVAPNGYIYFTDPRYRGKETRELEELPAQLEALEAELEALREKLADPQTYKDAPDTVSEQVAALEAGEARLETMFERWAELDEKR